MRKDVNDESNVNMPKLKQIYCHFSFRRPRDPETRQYAGYGIFSVAMFTDRKGTHKAIIHKTEKFPLWKNHQFVTAIQAYAYALKCIYDWQGAMMNAGFVEVYLVTDNSTLAGWIENPKKNKQYSEWMAKAVEPFKTGSRKEFKIGVGLCDILDYEKSYKFCKEEYIEKKPEAPIVKAASGKKLINLESSNIKYSTINEINAQDSSVPIIEGMELDD